MTVRVSHELCKPNGIMDSDEPESAGQTCAVCAAKSPPTDTNYTLISSRYGWRLSIEVSPDGRRNPVWRCPSCWQAFKSKTAANQPPNQARPRLK